MVSRLEGEAGGGSGRGKRKGEGRGCSAYLSESLDWEPGAFFLLGDGMRHSIEKATQLVQGMPRLAASHRTYFTESASGDVSTGR